MNSKHQKILEMLQDGRNVNILIDPRPISCWVPSQFKKQENLVLQVGLDRDGCKELSTTESTLTVTLRFNGLDYCCAIPWAHIRQMSFEGDAHGYSWEPALTEVEKTWLRGQAEKAEAEGRFMSPERVKQMIRKPGRSERPYLRLVK